MRTNLISTLALLGWIATASSARAQDGDAFAPATAAHRAGRWSMQFQLVEDFQFRAFEGAGLAMTRNAGTSAAWRLGVTLNGSFEGLERTITTTDSTVSQDFIPIDGHRYSVRVDLLRLRRYHPARRVGLELGIGPSVNLIRYGEDSDTNQPPFLVSDRGRASFSSYGLTGRFGVEVFLARGLSVHAHYGASAGYQQTTSSSHSEITYNDGTTSVSTFESQQRRWFLSNDGVSMGISVYL